MEDFEALCQAFLYDTRLAFLTAILVMIFLVGAILAFLWWTKNG